MVDIDDYTNEVLDGPRDWVKDVQRLKTWSDDDGRRFHMTIEELGHDAKKALGTAKKVLAAARHCRDVDRACGRDDIDALKFTGLALSVVYDVEELVGRIADAEARDEGNYSRVTDLLDAVETYNIIAVSVGDLAHM